MHICDPGNRLYLCAPACSRGFYPWRACSTSGALGASRHMAGSVVTVDGGFLLNDAETGLSASLRAERSNPWSRKVSKNGLLRRFAPRNDRVGRATNRQGVKPLSRLSLLPELLINRGPQRRQGFIHGTPYKAMRHVLVIVPVDVAGARHLSKPSAKETARSMLTRISDRLSRSALESIDRVGGGIG